MKNIHFYGSFQFTDVPLSVKPPRNGYRCRGVTHDGWIETCSISYLAPHATGDGHRNPEETKRVKARQCWYCYYRERMLQMSEANCAICIECGRIVRGEPDTLCASCYQAHVKRRQCQRVARQSKA